MAIRFFRGEEEQREPVDICCPTKEGSTAGPVDPIRQQEGLRDRYYVQRSSDRTQDRARKHCASYSSTRKRKYEQFLPPVEAYI